MRIGSTEAHCPRKQEKGRPMSIRLEFLLIAALALGCASTQPGRQNTTHTRATDKPTREGLWQIRDTRLFVRDVGPLDAPVLVVVHGGPGGNHRSQLPLEALAPEFRVVSYDQRGTGESDRFDVPLPELQKLLTLEENVEDLEALRVRLGRERISVIGHSWGGALATFYAATYPESIDKLIVYSGGPEDKSLLAQKKTAHRAKMTTGELSAMASGKAALEAAMDRGVDGNELDRLFVDFVLPLLPSLYCKRPPAPARSEVGRGGFWANQIAGRYIESLDRSALAKKLGRLAAPTLLIWGRCEPSPRERLTGLLDAIPDAQFVQFEQSGHNAMEEEPELFFSTLRAFLSGKSLPMVAHRSRESLPPLKTP